MAQISRDSSGRSQLHKTDSTGKAVAVSPTSQDSGNITIGNVGAPGKPTSTTKQITGTQDAGSLPFSSGHIAAGATDKSSNLADNYDPSYKNPGS